MPGSAPIFNQERSYQLLSAFIRNKTVPHALLFSGLKGIGKQEAAEYMAMVLNCHRQPRRSSGSDDYRLEGDGSGIDHSDPAYKPIRPCGICSSCKKIQSGSHPDVGIVKPAGSLIKIAQIRSVCHTLTMKPFEARYRVVVILDAYTMNASAGNALLKALEEPPERTVIILVADQTAHIPPTVISRCQPVRFSPIPRKEIVGLLIATHGAETTEAEIIASMANGSYSVAREMLETGWIPLRNWLISEIDSLFSKGPVMPLAFAERLSRNKNNISQALAVIQSWFRDLMVCKYDPEKIINKDVIEKIEKTAGRYSISDLVRKMDAVAEARRAIQTNANVKLVLETMLNQLV